MIASIVQEVEIKMLGTCMWNGCEEKAQYETPLDYPKIFLCPQHFDTHRRLANRQQSKIMKVNHSSFTKRQRNKHLKEKYR